MERRCHVRQNPRTFSIRKFFHQVEVEDNVSIFDFMKLAHENELTLVESRALNSHEGMLL